MGFQTPSRASTNTWCTTRSRKSAEKISRNFGCFTMKQTEREGWSGRPSSSSWSRTRFSSSFTSNRRALWVCRFCRRQRSYCRYRFSSEHSGDIMRTARTADLVVVGLIVGVHVAIVDVHVPRVGRMLRLRRRRPIVGRLDIWSAHFGWFTNGRQAPSRIRLTGDRSPGSGYNLLSAHASRMRRGRRTMMQLGTLPGLHFVTDPQQHLHGLQPLT